MNVEIEDSLELAGVIVGPLLVLVGIFTLIGTPWAYTSGHVAITISQILGALSAIVIGAGLAWVAYAGR